jgi:hypothetical protein
VQLYSKEVYHIPPLAYLDQEGSYCYLAFSPLDSDHFVLGNTFLFNFYTIYDIHSTKVGVVPHKWSRGIVTTNGVPAPPDDPTDPVYHPGDPTNVGGNTFPVWAIIVIVIAGLVILVGLAVFSFIRYRRGKGLKTPDGGAINEEILE